MPTEPMGPVVVGVAGSSWSTAVDLAADEAAGRVVPLVLLQVGNGHPEDGARPGGPGLDLLSQAVGWARAEHPGISVAGQAVPGDPADVLVTWAKDASLLVVGRPGAAHRIGQPVESVISRVIGRTGTPVMVHRPLDTPAGVTQPRPVLVGIVATAEAEPLVRLGFDEAALRGAPLYAVLVWPATGAVVSRLPGDSRARQEAERSLTDALAGWSRKYPEVRVRAVARRSPDVTAALLAASQSAQLVVVGTSRFARPRGLVPGSIAYALVYHAGCPVAVARTP